MAKMKTAVEDVRGLILDIIFENPHKEQILVSKDRLIEMYHILKGGCYADTHK